MDWNLLPLHLFPEGSLSSSVITTVWIGVLVVAFFNLRFGWCLSGLVVPGYLVPLLLIKPWSVAVILGESVVTYLLVYGFSVLGARWLGLADFFGRDRFFALVLVSVMVRVLFDTFWLPGFGAWLNAQGVQFDYANNLHSFGLIIVALIANNFWKPGLLRGGLQLLSILAITFVIVRFGLMELTNFSLSNLNYLYEDIASSILASPKAYIILLTTAWIASRLNLHYAWEFNGILIPALLALQWYQPVKLATTFAEVLVILTAAHLLLKLPQFANVNLSGARKLVMFFSVGFVYKLLLGFGLEWFAPRAKVTDYFAFGYLIATLLAVKIHDKDIGIRVTRATLQTSLMAVLLASLVGFALSLLPGTLPVAGAARQPLPAPAEPADRLEQLLLQQRIVDYGVVARHSLPLPGALQLSQFQQALEALKDYRHSASSERLQQAQAALAQLDYELVLAEQRYLVLRPRGLSQGWGTFVIDSQPGSGLLIEVPVTGRQQGIAEAALALFRSQQAAALALGSLRLQQGFGEDPASDVTRNPGTLFQQFHQQFGPRNVLQLRLLNRASARALQGARLGPEQALGSAALRDQLWVSRELPADLQLRQLEQQLGQLDLHWGSPDIPSIQRERSPGGFAELFIQPDAVRRLLAAARIGQVDDAPLAVLEGPLHAHLLQRQQAAQRLTRYPPPQLEQLLFLDNEVLTPLLQLLADSPDASRWGEAEQDNLRYLNGLARSLGYQLVRHQSANQHFLLLQPDDGQDAPPWGIHVLRIGSSAPQIVEVPRAGSELNTLTLGIRLFEQLQARALLIASVAADADPLGRADVIHPQARHSLFNLLHQVLLREAGDAPLLVSQVRGLGQPVPDGYGSLLSFGNGLQLGEHVAPCWPRWRAWGWHRWRWPASR